MQPHPLSLAFLPYFSRKEHRRCSLMPQLLNPGDPGTQPRHFGRGGTLPLSCTLGRKTCDPTESPITSALFLIFGRIVDLLKQIFWRQSMYHRNNTRYHYGYHKVIESTDGPQNNSTPVSEAVKPTTTVCLPITSLQHRDSQIRCVKIYRPQMHDRDTEQEVIGTCALHQPQHMKLIWTTQICHQC